MNFIFLSKSVLTDGLHQHILLPLYKIHILFSPMSPINKSDARTLRLSAECARYRGATRAFRRKQQDTAQQFENMLRKRSNSHIAVV